MQMEEIYLAGLTREEEDYLTPVPKQAQQTNRQRAVDASEDDVGNDLDPTYME